MMEQSDWHKCRCPIIPRSTVDGGLTDWKGQTWRRKLNGRWEYQQEIETEQEFLDRSL